MSIPVVPVVMCTWRRIENLSSTIETLRNQKQVKVHLYLWNNNPAIARQIDDMVSETDLPVTVIHSEKNVGGFGRFYYAKELADTYEYIVFIDDDQLLDDFALTTLWKEAKPRTLSGWWAYNFITSSSYWLRVRARHGGAAAYIGTCGMIADSSIFKDERLFECPKEFWFIEDLWLSYFANHVYKWKLVRSHARFRFLPDTKNQFMGLVNEKTQFLRYLKSRGWQFRVRLIDITR